MICCLLFCHIFIFLAPVGPGRKTGPKCRRPPSPAHVCIYYYSVCWERRNEQTIERLSEQATQTFDRFDPLISSLTERINVFFKFPCVLEFAHWPLPETVCGREALRRERVWRFVVRTTVTSNNCCSYQYYSIIVLFQGIVRSVRGIPVV